MNIYLKLRQYMKAHWLLAIAVLVSLVVGWLMWLGNKVHVDVNDALAVAVQQGPLVISVTEAGTLKPRELTVIKSELEGRSIILYLIEEGVEVQKGALLVELDASQLLDSRVEQEIRVQNLEAQFIQARENLEVVKNQVKADLDNAEQELRFAIEDFKNYQAGEYPNEQRKLAGKIMLAEEELERSRQKLEWSRRLFDEKYLSAMELQTDELSLKKAEIELELARNNMQLFDEFNHRRNVDKLESGVRQAEMALERTRRRTAADIVQAESQLQAREAEFDRQQQRLNKIDEQIVKAKVYAPSAGTVVYATSTQINWRGNVEPLAEGQEVRERQDLIHLPASDVFLGVVKVHESNLKKIRVGLPVRLRVDALPGRMFTGRVLRIAPLPDPQGMFMNPDLKVYTTEILVDGGGDVLRTGMTCEAEIIVERHENALFIPVQCVVRIAGHPNVYIRRGHDLTPREIQVGLDNNRMIHVLSGLTAGEKVLLTPPMFDSTAVYSEPEADAEPPVDKDAPGISVLPQNYEDVDNDVAIRRRLSVAAGSGSEQRGRFAEKEGYRADGEESEGR